MPFTTWVASQNPGQLTPDKLSSGCDGKYQGVILATGNLVYSPDGGLTFTSALTAPEWLALRSYEASFHVPLIAPLDASSDSPAGRLPLAAYVYGAVPPLAVTVAE